MGSMRGERGKFMEKHYSKNSGLSKQGTKRCSSEESKTWFKVMVYTNFIYWFLWKYNHSFGKIRKNKKIAKSAKHFFPLQWYGSGWHFKLALIGWFYLKLSAEVSEISPSTVICVCIVSLDTHFLSALSRRGWVKNEEVLPGCLILSWEGFLFKKALSWTKIQSVLDSNPWNLIDHPCTILIFVRTAHLLCCAWSWIYLFSKHGFFGC